MQKPNQEIRNYNPYFLYLELIVRVIVIDWKTIYSKLRVNSKFCDFYLKFKW